MLPQEHSLMGVGLLQVLRTLDPWTVEYFGGNTSLCLWAVGSLTMQCLNLTTELSQHAHARSRS